MHTFVQLIIFAYIFSIHVFIKNFFVTIDLKVIYILLTYI